MPAQLSGDSVNNAQRKKRADRSHLGMASSDEPMLKTTNAWHPERPKPLDHEGQRRANEVCHWRKAMSWMMVHEFF